MKTAVKDDVFAAMEVFRPEPKTVGEKMEELAEKQTGLIKSLGKQARPFIRPAHGLNGIDSCLYCDREINDENPGKMVIMGTRQEHVCNPCFMKPEYQDSIDGCDVIVKEYNL
jgi:hypothetical protein